MAVTDLREHVIQGLRSWVAARLSSTYGVTADDVIPAEGMKQAPRPAPPFLSIEVPTLPSLYGGSTETNVAADDSRVVEGFYKGRADIKGVGPETSAWLALLELDAYEQPTEFNACPQGPAVQISEENGNGLEIQYLLPVDVSFNLILTQDGVDNPNAIASSIVVTTPDDPGELDINVTETI